MTGAHRPDSPALFKNQHEVKGVFRLTYLPVIQTARVAEEVAVRSVSPGRRVGGIAVAAYAKVYIRSTSLIHPVTYSDRFTSCRGRSRSRTRALVDELEGICSDRWVVVFGRRGVVGRGARRKVRIFGTRAFVASFNPEKNVLASNRASLGGQIERKGCCGPVRGWPSRLSTSC